MAKVVVDISKIPEIYATIEDLNGLKTVVDSISKIIPSLATKEDIKGVADTLTLIKTLRGPYYYNGSTYGANKANYFSNSSLTATGTYMGFRPVLEYKEPTYKSTNLWY